MCVVVGPISSLLTILLRKRFVRSQFVLPMLSEESKIKATSAALLQSGTEKRIQTKVINQKVMSFCVGNRHFPFSSMLPRPSFPCENSSVHLSLAANQSINQSIKNQSITH